MYRLLWELTVNQYNESLLPTRKMRAHSPWQTRKALEGTQSNKFLRWTFSQAQRRVNIILPNENYVLETLIQDWSLTKSLLVPQACHSNYSWTNNFFCTLSYNWLETFESQRIFPLSDRIMSVIFGASAELTWNLMFFTYQNTTSPSLFLSSERNVTWLQFMLIRLMWTKNFETLVRIEHYPIKELWPLGHY